jgi:hypothetical protein
MTPHKVKSAKGDDFRSFKGVTFSEDGQQVIYISQKGLMEYDFETEETTLLDTTINSTWVNRAWFSPDVSKVALLEVSQNNSRFTLYIADIPNEAR